MKCAKFVAFNLTYCYVCNITDVVSVCCAGESALHIAIVNGDFEMVRLLVENDADVNQRATGRFFLPEDQKKGRTKTTNYSGRYTSNTTNNTSYTSLQLP